MKQLLLVLAAITAVLSSLHLIEAAPSTPACSTSAAASAAHASTGLFSCPTEGLGGNMVAYNRCTYWSTDDQDLNCGSATCQSLFRLDSATKKSSIRFTLSPTLSGDQDVDSVWLYYETVGTWTSADYDLLICDDSASDPGAPDLTSVLGSESFQPQSPGGAAWHQIVLSSPATGLQPGSVYHVVIKPGSGVTPTGSKYIELVVNRGRIVVPYEATDGTGQAEKSPLDRYLAIMFSNASPDFFVPVANANVGYTPLFVLELEDEEHETVLWGQPYDQHTEYLVAGNNQYGESFTPAANLDVNYLAFWTRGSDCNSDCEGDPCEPHDLEFAIIKASSPGTNISTVVPATQFYRARSHWFGAFFEDTFRLDANTTYYLVIRSPSSTGATTDGWVYSMEDSTLPVHYSLVPTFRQGAAYAIESTNNGSSFHFISRKGDAGFMLGLYDAPQEIASECDHAVTSDCSSPTIYASAAITGDTLTFGGGNLNIGVDTSESFYMKLLGPTCNQLEPTVFTTGSIGANLHIGGYDINHTMASGPNFFFLEFGHVKSSVLIRDELFPVEVRNGACQ